MATEYFHFFRFFRSVGYTPSHLALFAENRFPAILAAILAVILNFCVKCKNAFISETVRDRVIWMEIWDCRGIHIIIYQVFQKSFPAIFGDHLEFLCRMKKKRIYL